jgi:hypothetical protein
VDKLALQASQMAVDDGAKTLSPEKRNQVFAEPQNKVSQFTAA